jgi:hypothetical protein
MLKSNINAAWKIEYKKTKIKDFSIVYYKKNEHTP